ncbi:MAG: hypothetical protein ACQEXV_03760 [Bacillota bacterium]
MNGLTPGNIDENNINTLLACMAFQELSLSHLINAEGEASFDPFRLIFYNHAQ